MAQEKYLRHCPDCLLLVWHVRQMAINTPGPSEPTGSAGTGLLFASFGNKLLSRATVTGERGTALTEGRWVWIGFKEELFYSEGGEALAQGAQRS